MKSCSFHNLISLRGEEKSLRHMGKKLAGLLFSDFLVFSYSFSFTFMLYPEQVEALNIVKMTNFQLLVLVIDRTCTVAIISNTHGIKLFQDVFL